MLLSYKSVLSYSACATMFVEMTYLTEPRASALNRAWDRKHGEQNGKSRTGRKRNWWEGQGGACLTELT